MPLITKGALHYLTYFVVIALKITQAVSLQLRLTIFLWLSLALSLSGQTQDSSFVHMELMPGQDTVNLGANPVLQESLRFTDSLGKAVFPNYQLEGSHPVYLIFSHRPETALQLDYRFVPLDLPRSYALKDTGLLLPPPQPGQAQALDKQLYRSSAATSFKPFEGLQSKGSISRAVGLGNNQDAVLTSDLNLQLAGRLSDRTEIRASITDNSLPVQADGYTQQLREFDRVYLELENPDFGLLRAGDYGVRSVGQPFLRFEKRISGAGWLGDVGNAAVKAPLEVQGGIARGKFARNRFQAEEGNQGPYRLRGANNENFIVIISGSERVYVDGILQKRGQQYDYVIDYNAGELTFTALQPMTKDKRIVVEFQYTEQNYLRSVAYGRAAFEKKNWQSSVRYYSEQDAKNTQLATEYSDREKQRLAQAGDRSDLARISTIQPSAYSPDLVQYRLRDTLGFDSVLVFSTDSTQSLYQASFAFLGAGQGDYQLAESRANGRVFKWVAPVNGTSQGSYAPVRQLIAPNRLQVLTIASRGQLAKGHQVAVDLAMSDQDQNLFSDQDDNNDQGAAGALEYRWDKPAQDGLWQHRLGYQFNQSRFRTVERLRRVEFARDWNLPLNYRGEIGLAQASSAYRADSSSVKVSAEHLQARGTQGLRGVLALNHLSQRHALKSGASWLEGSDSLRSYRFLRERLQYRFSLDSNLWLGVRSVGEWNRQRSAGRDSLLGRSYQFFEYSAFVGGGDTTATYWETGYRQRWDDTARGGLMRNFSRAEAYFAKARWENPWGGRLNAAANWRHLKITAPETLPLERTITSRLSYLQRLWSGAIISNSFYETGAGREARRSFSYVEVPPGTGTYTHTDYNGNGRKELDEFELAPTPDLATYVRVFTPNNNFVRTNRVKLGQNLNLQAPNAWFQGEGWRRFLSKFSAVFNYQLDRKTLLEGNTNVLNPFAEANDSAIVALSNNLRQTLFYNRSRNKFGADYTFRQSNNRNLLTYGLEKRSLREHVLNLRFSYSDQWIFRIRGERSDKDNLSGNFRSRTFSITAWGNRYALSYQPSDQLLLTASHQVRSAEGLSTQGSLLLVQQNSGLECTYNAAETLSFEARLNYIFNGFKGDARSPAGYDLLQALQPGRNATVDLTLRRTLLKNIVISLNYAGRFGRQSFAVHTGNVQIKAFF